MKLCTIDLRLYRTWDWVPKNDVLIGGPVHHELVHKDTLQYKDECMAEWKNVPIEEAKKPKHPDELKREKDMKEIDNMVSTIIKTTKYEHPTQKD